MKLTDLYQQQPTVRHQEIVVMGDRVFFDGEEFAIGPDGELRLLRSQKALTQHIDAIRAKLGA